MPDDGIDIEDLYRFLSMVSVGIIVADMVTHATGTADLMRQIAYAIEERCHVCGYKYAHPIVRHLGKRGVECGWR